MTDQTAFEYRDAYGHHLSVQSGLDDTDNPVAVLWIRGMSSRVPIRLPASQVEKAVASMQAASGLPAGARTLTPNEHDRAWHAIEHAAGQDDADPGTVLNAVLRALRINAPTPEDEQAASPRLRDAARQAAGQPAAERHNDRRDCPTWGPVASPGSALCSYECRCQTTGQPDTCACTHLKDRHNSACAHCPCIGYAPTWPRQTTTCHPANYAGECPCPPDGHCCNVAPADPTTADDPTPLRWGLGDVLHGDDDTVTICLSGPDREPYWLELDRERAAALRNDLAGTPAVGAALALRDRLRRAICEASGFAWDSDMLEPDEYGDHADAVLQILGEPLPEGKDFAPAVGAAPTTPDTDAQAHPPRVTWRVEGYDADEWNAISCTFQRSEDAHDRKRRIHHYPDMPTRVVRETTTWTVEADTADEDES